MHIFETSVALKLDRVSVFDFFSDAGNLERITPPELRFRIVTLQPIQIRQNTRIDYQLRLYGIPFSWQTEITFWNPPHKFIDSQIRGPYRSWIHTHHFQEADGGTLMHDRVEYKLPFSPFGELLFPLIQRQIKRIFSYRKTAILQILGSP
ncbi:MAG: SRPBCC family protein [Deltaproteobacteria bacterium]|mgnify:CR=1 FL=1|jgi:ligand-binding SRPBCC domain-containing protein|nr:SRPBCC family protein [Deltaproteobacteria bacterium]MBT4090200.1 SRPBCC family protein [Deltaproteobacteria bacterium]MBT4268322.1 SRPBCC family protein [Deltaproteobacteria bacterium]MBT4642305.1 SRPBCC family protein [Deltaproteobacteria bacterium]MBT6498959.1 SRPBCC family protein [Deltaproteobacteria bacterium]